MKFLDILILIFLTIMFLRGIFRGLIKEIFSLGGVLIGIYLSARYYPILMTHLSWLKHPPLIKVFSFLLILITTYIGFNTIGVILRKIFQTLFLGWLDRILGCIFGLLEGSFIVGILLFLLHLHSGGEEIIENSPFAKWFYYTFKEIIGEFLRSRLQI